MISLQSFQNLLKSGQQTGTPMPVIFAGHGSPMNAIEKNVFSTNWRKISASLPKPKAILVVSAHWLTRGSFVTAMPHPKTIHDFGGFPQALFDVNYPAPGNPQLAEEITKKVKNHSIGLDQEWGLDHGTWSVIINMYPEADIPVLQLSIDYTKNAAYHYELAGELQFLRDNGVLIIGSGNMIHNLGMVDWKKIAEVNYGYDWAIEINEILKKKIQNHQYNDLVQYQNLHKHISLAVPSIDHYFPMLYGIGLQRPGDQVSFFNDYLVAGSLNMTSFILHA